MNRGEKKQRRKANDAISSRATDAAQTSGEMREFEDGSMKRRAAELNKMAVAAQSSLICVFQTLWLSFSLVANKNNKLIISVGGRHVQLPAAELVSALNIKETKQNGKNNNNYKKNKTVDPRSRSTMTSFVDMKESAHSCLHISTHFTKKTTLNPS